MNRPMETATAAIADIVAAYRSVRPKETIMRAFVLCVLLLTAGEAWAATNATQLKFVNGKIVVAQSRCQMCDDQRTDCVVRCNGSGACIQSCNDDYQLCTERACQDRPR
jgi:hypothetical protein